MEQIVLPDNVKMIIDMLNQAGFEGFAVGGCVRDSLLGRQPSDWDITTNACADMVMSVFSKYKVVQCGLKHGTVSVVVNNILYEITTYRIDGKYSDRRRPDEVYFTQSLIEDLKRRDFTINAMAYNDERGLIDTFNGMKDLKQGILRCVGDESLRFDEDALRMMRAVRFAAQLDFNIAPTTLEAIRNKAYLLEKISVERIAAEFNKILISNNVGVINILVETGLMKYIVPEFIKCVGALQNNSYHIYDVGEHILKAVSFIENKLELRLAMFLHDIGKPECKTSNINGAGHFYNHSKISCDIAQEILKRMKYDNKTIKKIKTLILYHCIKLDEDEIIIRGWIGKIGANNFKDLLKVREADLRAQNFQYYKARHDKLMKVSAIADEIIEKDQCCSLSKLAINGNDLVNAGIEPGPRMGRVLKELLDMIIRNPQMNEKGVLLEYALTIYQNLNSN